ncbi:MAG TPA: S8 family serine peptidase [Solirubrobacterales bacterium]|nr:S8 family serine peptidase [Solirubrobacterales bacterium]
MIFRLSLALAALTALAPGTALAQDRDTVRGRALVLLERAAPGASASARSAVRASASAVIARHGLRRARPDVPAVGVSTVRIPPGDSVAALRRRLAGDPRVAAVEPEARHRLRVVPNDPALSAGDPSIGDVFQWYLHRQGFPAAWDLSRGAGAVVGIIDSGIDSAHPDLATKVKSAHDHDGNTVGTADEVGHGTHVSSLACGAPDNAFGIAGAGLDCQVVLEKSDLTGSSVIASLVDATDMGAGVINMSFGGGRLSAGEMRALRYALRKDVVLIAAAADQPIADQGHPAKDLQPTGTGRRISEGKGLVVTAADPSGGRASFAGRGSQISLAAMGDSGTRGGGIFAAFPANPTQIETGGSNPPGPPCTTCRTVFNGDSRFAYLAGTSMASPQVAGAVALVRAANPRLRRAGVVRIMKQTATRAAGASGWTTELGWGILNAGAAVQRAVQFASDTVAPRTSRRGGRSRSVNRRFTLKWRGRDQAPPGVAPAGIEAYSIYEKRGRKYKLIATTTSTRYRLRGRKGKRYRFAVRARDLAGNLEPTRRASFVIRVRR